MVAGREAPRWQSAELGPPTRDYRSVFVNALGSCFWFLLGLIDRSWVVPPPRIPVANEGLGWVGPPILKMFHVILVVTSQHPGRGDNPR